MLNNAIIGYVVQTSTVSEIKNDLLLFSLRLNFYPSLKEKLVPSRV